MTPPYLTTHLLRLGTALAVLTLCTAAMLLHAPRALAWLPADQSGGSGLSSVAPGTSGGGSGLNPGSPTGRTGAPARTVGGRRAPVSPVHAEPGRLVIVGGGDGHGVGMSQYGAEGYALHGASAAAIIGHYYSGTVLAPAPAGALVRVLVGSGRGSFSGATRAGAVRLSAADTYTVAAGGLGLRVLTTSGRTVASSHGTLIVTGPGPLSTGGRRYRGALSFTASPTGGVQTVDVVALDDYVRGVISEEMDASWAPAALEAQAIAARTYALSTSVSGHGYSLYDDTRSQMYGGVDAETATTNAAVAATAGEIATYGGRPAVTFFFASSGGETESIQNVWPGAAPEPWLVGVPDPYDGAAEDPYHRWTVTLSISAATRRLGSLVRGRLERIVVTRRGVSPRIIAARVVGTRGVSTVTGSQLAQAFGLLSTNARFLIGPH